MANAGHLVRRTSQREMVVPQKSLERIEMRDMRNRLVQENGGPSYGTTNQGFEDPQRRQSVKKRTTSVTIPEEAIQSPTRSEKDLEALDAPPPGDAIQASATAKPGDGVVNDRESWDSKWQYLLAVIGYAVGLGSVWRFPYLCQKNGGGAFLFPYLIMLAVEGIPVFYLELAVGQRLRKGAIGVWNQVSPYCGGIGVASAFVSFNVALYYNTIIAWCLYYLAGSFRSPLPWTDCPKTYYTNSSYKDVKECAKSSPTEYFWYRDTLDISPDINHPEKFNWKIALCLIIAWVLTYLCMAKGIASSGKVVYVTAPFPYLVLVIFFVRGITLPGMEDGLKHLFTPDWTKILDPTVWLEAGTQIFFSLGLAFGGLIAFSSYNPVHNNCFRDAVVCGLINCCTAIFAAVVVFSVLGFKAHMQYEECVNNNDNILMERINTTDVISIDANTVLLTDGTNITIPELQKCDLQETLRNSASGTGLAFIVFTEAINQFPWAPFWSVLFFLMLFTLGIDSEFGTLEGVITSVVDLKVFPNLRKEFLTALACTVCCTISMAFAHGAGNYVFILFDDFSGNIPLLIVAFFECVSVSYVYGLRRFSDDIELMIGSRPHSFFLACWKYVSPAVMLTILLASIIKQVMSGSGYMAWNAQEGRITFLQWPTWAWGLVAVMVLVSALWIPLIALTRLCGIHVIQDEEPAWFPAEELREYYAIVPHKVTQVERKLFCIREDGSEGLCCPINAPPQESV
ncbi:sodium-dependent neutral amino acid transporter B(0)AT3-like isoform X1 [Portunus trituberculatus]|uniref:sodium-dependent neutral amino acid transporter B(0)AT3-like isoform X1 n=1 Tax=Portunus trituberculatus TaxID=210409 RepID=UPI001E1CCB75|nr:sodium-dependent neutral amino acid transporter B(0)AT3-like isoform X1 [Portunus trituberculatus]XP_045127644.1 sodium-dependent neutral amino acid transporter B(0)AT3-like isoform X1 [Portunus trituberculatus]